MIPPLPTAFLQQPLAHRGYHDLALGRPENSMAAFDAAIEAGYGIELDIQPSADGVPMAFHDYDMRRMTGIQGPVTRLTAEALGQTWLKDSDQTISPLSKVLARVAGRVPVLIEVKDQDGAMGPGVGPLERAIADVLSGYTGDVAVMSFNPHSVAVLAQAAPDVPRGLTTSAFLPEDWPLVSAQRRAVLREIPDFERVQAGFISHDVGALKMTRVAQLKRNGTPVLCWTVKSPQQEADAREIADNITFEGYHAAIYRP